MMLSLFSALFAGLLLASGAEAPPAGDRVMTQENGTKENASAQMIGPFALRKARHGSEVEVTLTIARPLSRTYRYELVINGSSNVRNVGRAGPAARVGATLCNLKFSGTDQWAGRVIITDEHGKSETLKL